MDEDTDELIAQLCTRTGMIMEDVVDLALTLGTGGADKRAAGLKQLKQASVRISCLIDAANALAGERLGNDTA